MRSVPSRDAKQAEAQKSRHKRQTSEMMLMSTNSAMAIAGVLAARQIYFS